LHACRSTLEDPTSDNNVFINITAGKFSYIGEWRYSTMRGIQNWGKIQFFESK